MQRYLPYAGIRPDFPTFRLTAHTRRPHWEPSRLLWFTRKWMVITLLAVVILWIAALGGENPWQYPGSVHNSNFLVSLFFISIGMAVLMDFRVLAVTAGSFAGERIARRWDMLRLTPLATTDLVAAQDAIGQLRVWRFMAVITALRLSLVLLMLVNFIFSVSELAFGVPLHNLMLALTSALFACIYCIEPYWRMRAVVALGLWLSARLTSSLSITLAALVAVMALWLSQAIILGVMLWLVGRSVFSNGWVPYLLVFILCALTGLIVGIYYRLLRGSSLRATIRRAEVLSG